LRQNLKRNWRNKLNQSEKRDLILDIDEEGKSLKFLMQNYVQDRLEKKYAGPSPKMVAALAEFTLPTNECLVLNAISGDEIIASILIFLHGRSATYQIGWSSSAGRDNNAHYFLLWHALRILKEKEITALDLGGVNDEGAKGVKTFKSGMGGHEITLIGQYD
jgi:lipid II:glycine glycyltransferase (peptidoglycan interpeptide bridge formation enzyme)